MLRDEEWDEGEKSCYINIEEMEEVTSRHTKREEEATKERKE